MIGQINRPWSRAHDDELVRLVNLKIGYKRIGVRLGRTDKSIKKRVQTLRRANPERFTRAGPEPIGPAPATTDDAGHVMAVLLAGGYGFIPLAWHEPRLKVWRAA